MKTFVDLSLSDQLYQTINSMGYTQPTEIQEQTIPDIVSGKDVVGESATGSGKTLAFACGVIERTVPRNGLQSLILTPTRELAEQVKKDINKLSRSLRIISIYGGVSIGPQIADLHYAEVVIATPGRLLDHMQRGTVNLSRIKLLVLDEADRMLDMGFIYDVERIIKQCPRQRQTLFFSATISREIKNLTGKYMINPKIASAAKYVDPAKLKQVYYDVSKNDKLSLLAHLIKTEGSRLVLVFCNTQRATKFVAKQLKAGGINATLIHGGLSQNVRAQTIETFNNSKSMVLVCTDIAARGLHIPNVSHVYNYDLPRNPVDYVHRIGRTARVGADGKVINLLSDADYANFGNIEREYDNFIIQSMQRPKFDRLVVQAYNEPQEFSRPRNRFHSRFGRVRGRHKF